MNKSEAKRLVENGITYKYIKDLLIEARNSSIIWDTPSKPNKSLSVGTMFNIMWKYYGKQKDDKLDKIISGVDKLSSKNIIWQFSNIKITKPKKQEIKCHHQEPINIEE